MYIHNASTYIYKYIHIYTRRHTWASLYPAFHLTSDSQGPPCRSLGSAASPAASTQCCRALRDGVTGRGRKATEVLEPGSPCGEARALWPPVNQALFSAVKPDCPRGKWEGGGGGNGLKECHILLQWAAPCKAAVVPRAPGASASSLAAPTRPGRMCFGLPTPLSLSGGTRARGPGGARNEKSPAGRQAAWHCSRVGPAVGLRGAGCPALQRAACRPFCQEKDSARLWGRLGARV